MEDYFKEHLLSIVKEENLDVDTIKACLKIILDNEILSRSTEDLEYKLNK